MTELSDYLTSDYISRLRNYALDRTREIVMAYVEGDDDINFWKAALDTFGNTEKYRFEVVTNKMTNENPDAPNGKSILLTMRNLGRNKVICVDADWDLLVDDYSDHTETLRSSVSVINTTYYSLENILLSPEFHNSLMNRLGLDEAHKEYEELLKSISRLCESLFVLMLSYAKEEDSHNKLFWFDDFGQCINKLKTNDLGDENKMNNLIRTCEEMNASLICNQATLMEQVRNELIDKGYASEDLWKLMRGHNLYASIVKPWVKKRRISLTDRKIKAYIEKYGTSGIESFKKSLGAALGNYKTIDEAIDVHIYQNFPNPSWLPKETEVKIHSLFSNEEIQDTAERKTT